MTTAALERRSKKRLRSALDRLGAMRTDADANALRRLRSTEQALIVIDETSAIASASSVDSFHAIGAHWAFDPTFTQLSPELSNVVRSARAEWCADREGSDVIAVQRGKHVMLLVRLHAFGGNHLVVSFELLQRRATLRDEASRYDLTPREYEVLRLALGGFSAAEIAVRLAIAETTAQVYLKRLLQKTNSRNRAQMVALVLGSRMSHDADVHDVIGLPCEPAAIV